MCKKVLLVLLTILIVSAALFSYSYADNISTDFPDTSNVSIEKIDNSMKKIWGTVVTIVQIVAIAAVIFAGLRYMYASANQRADIKKGLAMLTLGAILVFAASTVVQFVVNAAEEVL